MAKEPTMSPVKRAIEKARKEGGPIPPPYPVKPLPPPPPPPLPRRQATDRFVPPLEGRCRCRYPGRD